MSVAFCLFPEHHIIHKPLINSPEKFDTFVHDMILKIKAD